jgi:RNA-directed DNA polymerase
MKRHGNLFERIVSTDNLVLAYDRARKGKNWQRAVKAFDPVLGLDQIRMSLIDGTFRTSPYRTKTIFEPKKRTVYILPFAPDRIVHHAIMNVVEPIWESLFIHDSYACRKGKGIHAGSTRTMEFVRRNRYCLQCDIRKFYPSMQHDIAFGLIERKIKCRRTLDLFHDIVYSPGNGANIPIGNYTSQWIGNLYLNELDHYVKNIGKVRDYIRYCDDFLLFHNDKGLLREAQGAVRAFSAERLGLSLSVCEVFPVTQGVDFLGYRHFPGYVLLRKSTAQRIMRRFRRLPHLLDTSRVTLDQLRSAVASISGWIGWAQTRHFAEKLRLPEIKEALYAA